MLNRPEEYRKMAQAEGELWWYRELHHLVAEALAGHPLGHDARVLDAGCGTGGLLLSLQRLGYRRLSGFDVSPTAVGICAERHLPVTQLDLREIGRGIEPESAEAIVSNDTLCYFSPEDQERITRLLWGALAPGGLLVLNLPALPAFRGIHDVSVGIRQRFSLADLARLLPAERFEVLRARYWPFLLSPVIYAVRCTQRRRLCCHPQGPIRSDVSLPPRWLNRFLETITRLERTCLPRTPFGSSLFLVARKL